VVVNPPHNCKNASYPLPLTDSRESYTIRFAAERHRWEREGRTKDNSFVQACGNNAKSYLYNVIDSVLVIYLLS